MPHIKFYQVGYTVVVTTSPTYFERQKDVGATEVIGYKAADMVDKLRELGAYKHLFTASGEPALLSCLRMSMLYTQLFLEPQDGRSTESGETGVISNTWPPARDLRR
jgi:hypothetical protein